MWRISYLFGVVLCGLLAAGCGEAETRVTSVEAGAAVEAAFTQTAQASSFTVTQSIAQTFSLPFAGIDTRTEIDPDNPSSIAEVSPVITHIWMDFGSILGPEVAEAIGPTEIEMWMTPDMFVVDTTSLKALSDLNPGMSLGPLEPGLAFIDLQALNVEGPEVVSALAGSEPVDLAVLAVQLPVALRDIRQVRSNPTVFSGSASFAALSEAFGNDIEILARSTAAGVALNFDIDVDALTEIYVSFYEETLSEVTIELDQNEMVSVVSTRADLSGIYEYLFSDGNAAALGFSESEADEEAVAFAGAVFIMETRTTYEINDQLIVEQPPHTTDDRTSEWLEFLVSAGFSTN